MLLLEHAITPYPWLFHCAICEGHVHSGKYSWLLFGTIKLFVHAQRRSKMLKGRKRVLPKVFSKRQFASSLYSHEWNKSHPWIKGQMAKCGERHCIPQFGTTDKILGPWLKGCDVWEIAQQYVFNSSHQNKVHRKTFEGPLDSTSKKWKENSIKFMVIPRLSCPLHIWKVLIYPWKVVGCV